MKSITSFKGTFLSNFWPAQVFYRGVVWPTVEHAYQASKCALDVDFERFKGLNAGQAKRLGRAVMVRPDWDEVKVSIMRGLLATKFKRGSRLTELLLATGDAELIEGNYWRDTFWGQCPIGNGQNWLGRLLMEQREKLR